MWDYCQELILFDLGTQSILRSNLSLSAAKAFPRRCTALDRVQHLPCSNGPILRVLLHCLFLRGKSSAVSFRQGYSLPNFVLARCCWVFMRSSGSSHGVCFCALLWLCAIHNDVPRTCGLVERGELFCIRYCQRLRASAFCTVSFQGPSRGDHHQVSAPLCNARKCSLPGIVLATMTSASKYSAQSLSYRRGPQLPRLPKHAALS